LKTVLLVCTGNLCRSPMATVLLSERLASAGLGDLVRVESAGVWAREGAPASEEARKLMAGRAFNLENHRARQVTESMLAGVDLVLVMEEAQRRSLFHLSMQHLRKVYLLSEMSGGHADVPDPFGGTREDYERTIGRLDSLLEAGFPRILKLLNLPQSGADGTSPGAKAAE
jgi:protein-tyrosine phosphatase